MKNSLSKLLLAALCLGTLSACSTPGGYQTLVSGQHAQTSGTSSLSVPMDTPLYIGPFSRLDGKCRVVGQARPRILKSPRHGRLRIIKRSGGPGFDADSPLAHCDSVKVVGPTFDYMPKRGFTGEDSFVFQVIFPDGEKRVLPYRLLVRPPR